MATLKRLYQKYGMFIRYLIIGGLTTVINLAVFDGLTFLKVHWFWANLWAWLASVVFAFFTNKSIVFQSKNKSKAAFWGELVAFFALRGASLVLDMGIMWLGIDILHGNEYLVKLIDQVVVIIANYVFSKMIFVRKP